MIILAENNSPDFSYLLFPRSVALMGASTDTNTIEGRVLINLQKSRFKGKIYPVCSGYNEIFGIQVYSDLMSIPEQIDTVIITEAPGSVLTLLNECEEKKVKFIILLTGFFELPQVQPELRKTLRSFSDRTGIRSLSPNSNGLFNMVQPFGITSSIYYEPNRLQNGKISLITVDGGLGRTILDSVDHGIGFNYLIDTGNEVDLEVADFIKYLAYDSSTHVIFAIVEGIKDQQKFRNAAEAANRAGKPLIVLNIGQPEMGVVNHQAGVISVTDLDEFMYIGWLFIAHGIPAGNRIGIFSYSAGINTYLANKCRLAGLDVPALNNKTKSLLYELAPDLGIASNPIHITPPIIRNLGVFREYLETFANDPNLDVILVPFSFKLGNYSEIMVRQTLEVAKRMNKPIIPLWTSLSGEMEVSYEILLDSRLPFYRTADSCILAVKHFTNYYMNRNDTI